MEGQSLLPENESNVEDYNQQQYSPTPFLVNQNNNAQISLNSEGKELAKPIVTVNPQQGPGMIMPLQMEFSKYTNLNQLNHMHINQVDNNIFNIRRTSCQKICKLLLVLPLILVAIFMIIFGIYIKKKITIIIGILVVLSSFVLFYALLSIYVHTINFILGPNDITVEEIAFCKKKITNYQPGHLSTVELTSYFSHGCRNKYNSYISFKMDGDGASLEKNYFCESKDSQIYTPEEIGYFNYVMNHHIQTKMMVQNEYQV